MATYPKVCIEFMLSDAKADLIAERIDVAFRGGPMQDSGYIGRQVLSDDSDGLLTGSNGADEEVQFAPRFSGNTALALRKAAVAGIGITLLPYAIARRDIDAGLLVPVLPQYKRTGRALHVLYPSRRHLPLAVSVFIDLVVEKLSATR